MMCSDNCKVLPRFEMLKPITRKKNGEISKGITEVRESNQNCTNK